MSGEEMMTSEFVADFKALHDDPQLITLQLSKYQAWCLMAAVQLAFRHPLGRTTAPMQVATTIARDLQLDVSQTRLLAHIAELGWTVDV